MFGILARLDRKAISDVIPAVAIVGGIVSVLFSTVILIAGTSAHQNRDGQGSNLFLRDLAFVSFDGILANNDSSQFLVHLHLFANSFAWEYPQAPRGIPSVGIAGSGPGYTSNVLESLHNIARDLELQQDTWDCPKRGAYEDPCSNIFFEAFRSWLADGGLPIPGWALFVLLIASIVVCTMAISHEWMIRHRPYWMKCRCLVGKRWCPCPRGTKEEIEKLDDFTWDKIRLAYWALAAVYFLLPAIHTNLTSSLTLQYLDHFEKRLPEGISMHPRRNSLPEIMLWVACGSSSLSALCMLVKWKLSRRPKGWTEELGRFDEAGQGDDDESRRVGNERYTD